MKIAQVHIDIENLPSKEVIIRMALNTLTYRDDPNALYNINKEIEKSGLYKENIVYLSDSIPKEKDGLHRIITKKSKSTKSRK